MLCAVSNRPVTRVSGLGTEWPPAVGGEDRFLAAMAAPTPGTGHAKAGLVKRFQRANLSVGLVAIALAAACGSTAGTQSGACASGQVYCTGCGSGGFCATGQCPAFTCPAVSDGGAADGSLPSGTCPAGQAACSDCSGGTICVVALCGAIQCPPKTLEAGADAEQVACFGQLCAPGETCCPRCAPATGSCGLACTGVACPPIGDASGDGKTEAGPVDGGACPATCNTDLDCNPCPQRNFGGWSCSGGKCAFMG